MKIEHKVLSVSIVLGLLVGGLDASLDYFFFYKKYTFWGISILDIPRHEIFNRVLILVCFVFFGFICAKIISRQKAVEAEKAKLIYELAEALSEIKTLGSFLPICASCKKIRDDKGYWKQLETYIRDHSGTEFSHGICPDCAVKLYPEYYEPNDCG